MLEDGRCDLCGSDITCHCGQYSQVKDMKLEKQLNDIKRLYNNAVECIDSYYAPVIENAEKIFENKYGSDSLIVEE